jgi:hypothetical protein
MRGKPSFLDRKWEAPAPQDRAPQTPLCTHAQPVRTWLLTLRESFAIGKELNAEAQVGFVNPRWRH